MTMAEFLFVLSSEGKTESAGSIQLYIDSGFFFQRFCKLRVKIAAGAGKPKKLVLMINFHLWCEDAAGGPRSLAARPPAFNQYHVTDAALSERAGNRQS